MNGKHCPLAVGVNRSAIVFGERSGWSVLLAGCLATLRWYHKEALVTEFTRCSGMGSSGQQVKHRPVHALP